MGKLDIALFLIVSLPFCLLAAESPCTLYKPRNIRIAKENIKQYKWAENILKRYVRAGNSCLEKDKAFFDAMVPDLTPWPVYGQNCPACVGKQSSMGETGLYRWSVKEPDKLTCKYCKTVYPNPKYPEAGSMTAPKMGQTFTFYLTDEERAHPEDKSGKYAYRWASWPVHTSWSGLIRRRKAAWAISKVLPLAKAYALTDDARYAERAAWILDRLACVYPKWLYHSYNGTYADCPPAEAAREMGRHPRAGKFPIETIITAFPGLHTKKGYAYLNAGFWGAGRFCAGVGGEGGFLLNMTVAYDLIRNAKHPDGRPVLTPEMDKRIREDLILAGCADLENYDSINNKCGPGRALSAAVGILFDRPQSVRRGLEGFKKLLEDCFHFDGFCRESPSYSSMHLGLMRNIPEILSGYSDPEGYRPEKGPVFKDFDPFDAVPRYRLALESMVTMLRPDLKFPVIGDTHAGGGISPLWAEILAARYGDRYAGLLEAAQRKPLAERGGEHALWYRRPDLKVPGGECRLPLRTEYFPGWQVAVMRQGIEKDGTAFYFNGYEMHGHRHYDTLGIIYFALGKELAADQGYIWDDPRNAWTKSTYSHNLVTVDGQNQIGKGRRSRLDFFGTSPDVTVVQASANAYKQCTEYRRTCALIRIDEKNTYAADFFRVAGGKVHHYCLHCLGSFLGVSGPKLTPKDGKISWMENLREDADPPEQWHATWDVDGVKMRLWMATPLDSLIVADAPGWRSYKGDQLHAPPVAQVLGERKGNPATSLYACVMEPFAGDASAIRSVTRLAPDPDDPGAVGLKIEMEGRTDYVLSCPDDKTRTFGPVSVAARFAVVSMGDEGKLRFAYFIDGTSVKIGDHAMRVPKARTVRSIIEVDGQRVRLDRPLSEGMSLKGSTFLSGGTGFEIDRVKGKDVFVRNYPFEGGKEFILPRGAYVGSK
ncbi:MAG: hypothetical protein GXP25_04830 [Planctomycetes bacterium]|nr:hypothetical protein [Planctomycetota bacterium]